MWPRNSISKRYPTLCGPSLSCGIIPAMNSLKLPLPRSWLEFTSSMPRWAQKWTYSLRVPRCNCLWLLLFLIVQTFGNQVVTNASKENAASLCHTWQSCITHLLCKSGLKLIWQCNAMQCTRICLLSEFPQHSHYLNSYLESSVLIVEVNAAYHSTIACAHQDWAPILAKFHQVFTILISYKGLNWCCLTQPFSSLSDIATGNTHLGLL